jgi:hypothetical protein
VLKRVAFGFGAAWTAAILYFLIEADIAVRLLMAAGLGPVAGLGTPHMFDLLKWLVYTAAPAVGRWLLEFVKARLAALVASFKPPPPPPSSP